MSEEVIAEVSKESAGHGEGIEKNGDLSRVGVSGELPKTPETTKERVEGKYQELLSKVVPATQATPVPPSDGDIVLDAKYIGALTDEASKVQKLLDLASAKGVVHAVKVARSLRDYYALDTMHDELSGKFYDGLVAKGIIEKE